MDTQHFYSKWNNHRGNLLKFFDNLLFSETFVDVTLACNGSSIKAHKIVLSACSPFFEELLKNNPCKHPIVILKDLNINDLKTIVQFMYKGEVYITRERLSSLLKTAENLQIRGLTELGRDNQVEEKQNKPHKPSVAAKRRVQSENVKRTSVIHNDNDVVPSSRDSDCASPEIIERIPPKQRKQVLSQPEPEFTSGDNLDYSSSFNNALANSNMMNENNEASIDTTSKPSTSEVCENFEGSNSMDVTNEEMFNLTFDQYQNDTMKIQIQDAAANSKPSSPQIQTDHEISRVNSQNYDFDSYDPGNSMNFFNEPSFLDQSCNSSAPNILNGTREIQNTQNTQNSSHEMLGESSKSQSSRDSDRASPEIIERIPPKQRKENLSQPEPEFTSSDNLDYSSPFNHTLANSNTMNQNNEASIDSISKPSTSEVCENFEGSNSMDLTNEEMFNLTCDQYQNDTMKIQTVDADTNSKPSSPQILAIQIDHEISRVKSQNYDIDSYDPGNSMDSFNDSSIQDHIYNSSAPNILNGTREMQSENRLQKTQNSSHEMLGECSKSQSSISYGVPQGTQSIKINGVIYSRRAFKCKFCEKILNSQSSLCNHLDSKHEITKRYKCKFCNKYLQYKSGLIRHVKKCNGRNNEVRRTFKCKFCEKIYNLKSSLSNHLDLKHKVTKRFKCKFCNKYFHHESGLIRHVKNCHG